jgi:hypothetical protein
VHPTAFEIARRKGLATEPETIEDILHDLDDAARFEVAVQTKTDRLLDRLIDQGEPGIRGFVEHGWSFSLYYGGGYYPVAEFKNKLQALSSSSPEGAPGSISNDFTRLMNRGEMDGYEDRYRNFEQLSFRLKRFMALNLVVMSGTTDTQQLAFEIEAVNDGPVMKCMVDILWQYYLKMDQHHPDLERFLMAQILKKLNQHPRYHDEIILQYRRLADDEGFVFRASIKEQVERLSSLIPDKPLRLSYDAQRLRTRLHQFEELRQRDADDPQLILLLAGILLRLDRCNEYPRLVREVYGIRELVRPVFEELVEQISPQDQARRTIRQTAQRLLRRVELDTAATLDEDYEQRYAGEGLVGSLYRLMGHPTAGPRDQPLSGYALDEKWSAKEIARELQRTKLYIPLGNRAVIALVFTGINSDKE